MGDDTGQTELRAPTGAGDPLPGTAGPLDIAMDAERHDPAPDSPARRLLVNQDRLVTEQIQLARNERFRNRIKTARDVALTGLVLLVIGAGLAFVQDARKARGLVAQPFSVPPDLAANGLTGTAVASQVLDRLRAMDAQADSIRAPQSVANDWEGELSVEIPQTGVSVADLSRWLRRKLGRETELTGEVFRTAEGITVAARTGEAAHRVSGPESELDRLLQQSAEAIYGQVQPYRYTVWLRRHGRLAESFPVFQRVAASEDPVERAWALTGWGTTLGFSLGDYRGGMAKLREALAVRPEMPLPRGNLSILAEFAGMDELSLRESLAVKRFMNGRAAEELTPHAVAVSEVHRDARIQRLTGDHLGAAATLKAGESLREYGGNVASMPFARARELAAAHDISAARRLLAARPLPAGALASERGQITGRYGPRIDVAASARDWAGVLRVAAEAEARSEPDVRGGFPTLGRPHVAYALAHLGRAAEAQALIEQTPLDCYRCLRRRAQIAELRGDRAAADRWFAEAARQAPSLPQAHGEWGATKLARGDIAGALPLLREAQRRGPRWADPLKYEGDALARQGKHRDAVRRFAEAAERAPRWGALHLAWGRSLAALGRENEARAKYAQAARLDLSGADRAAVQRLPVRTPAPAR